MGRYSGSRLHLQARDARVAEESCRFSMRESDQNKDDKYSIVLGSEQDRINHSFLSSFHFKKNFYEVTYNSFET